LQQQPVASLLRAAKTELAQLQQTSLNQVEQIRDVAIKPITAIQQNAEKQIKVLQLQTREQVRATCRATSRTAWWLFMVVLTSATSAAIAGTLAAFIN
jgi:hypothetical protein